MPEVAQVVGVIARDNNEVVQISGAEAANRFKLSTQVPTSPVYYTSGLSREIMVGKLRVQLKHTYNNRKLAHAGTKPGLALSALWYLGKNQVNEETIRQIHTAMNEKEFDTLRGADMPAWMSQKVESYSLEKGHD